MNKKFLVIGSFGEKNLGDDLFSKICVDKIKRQYSNAIIFISSNNSLPFLNQKVVYLKKNFFNLLKGVIKSDFILLCGGTRFHDHIRKQMYLRLIGYIFLFSYAKIFSKKIAIIGNGVGPVNKRFVKLFTKIILNLTDLTTVRDESSYNIGQQLINRQKIVKTFDIAACVLHREKKKNFKYVFNSFKQGQRGYILGVNVFPFWELYEKEYQEDLTFVNWLANQIIKIINITEISVVKIFEVNGAYDRELSNLMTTLLKKNNVNCELIEYAEDPVNFIEQMKICSIFISTKLHFSICAYLLQKPQILLSYHDKCTSFGREVGIINEYLLSIKKFREINLIELTKRLLTYTKKPHIFYSLAANEAIRNAELNFDLLFKLIGEDK